MNKKQYITPQTMTIELETMSIIAGSLKDDGTGGTLDSAKPATGGSTSHHTAERNYFDAWAYEDDIDDDDYQ